MMQLSGHGLFSDHHTGKLMKMYRKTILACIEWCNICIGIERTFQGLQHLTIVARRFYHRLNENKTQTRVIEISVMF